MLQIVEKLVSSKQINQLYSVGALELPNIDRPVNSYLILRSEIDLKNSALVRHAGNGMLHRLRVSDPYISGIKPKDSKQSALVDCMLNSKIPLNIAVGKAGTGKTTLAIALALSRLEEGYPIYLAKSTSMVGRGRAFGPVPGDVQDKFKPFLDSFKIVLKELGSSKSDAYFELLNEKRQIKFVPIEYARGNTYKECTFIIDEAQNLTWHELNTIISRMGKDTKIIVLGDLRQIDVRMHYTESGLWKMVNSKAFSQSQYTSAIELEAQYRSVIAELMSDIDEELYGE